ncbi:hypothetical protein [Embleya sp. NBC_00896]|uniref:hypothetical protein n=1 Tax=Embleya sp. NBC_00896 TaxID=2975961 RepID=UPI0038696122|nr:hypothetical protein OG928_31765 [Embleya sp. NBC_00896]
MNGFIRVRAAAASAGGVLAALAMTAVAATPAAATPAAAADNPSGFSFNSAGEIGPGVHRESMVVGDFLFWRVFVQPGQKLSIKGSVDIPADFPYKQGPRFIVNLYNPLREAIPLLNNPTNQLVPGTTHLEASSGAWTVGDGKKYENFDGTKGSFKEFKDDKYALRGSYYIQMSISGAEGPQRGIVVPIKLEVSVEGTVVQRPDQPAGPEEAPRPAEGTVPGAPPARTETPVRGTAPAAAGADGRDTSSVASDWGVPGGGAVLAFLLAAGLGYALRRRFAVAAPVPASPWSAHTTAAAPTHTPGVATPPVAPNPSVSSGYPGFEPVSPPAPPPAPPVAPPVPEPPATSPPALTWRPGGAEHAPGTAPESDEVTQAFESPRRPEHPPGAAPRSD